MSSEAQRQAAIMLAIGSDPAIRLFRNNTGQAWQGETAGNLERLLSPRLPPGTRIRVLLNPRPVNFGLCAGSSDLIGWQSMVVMPNMVGERIARFLALEVKDATGRPTVEQQAFLARLRSDGGAGDVVRTPENAREVTKQL